MAARLLSIGLTTLDIVGRPIDEIPKGGGTKLIDAIVVVPAGTAGGTALVAAKLGLPTAIASAVGDDGAGRFVRQEFERAGVDTSLLRTHPTRPTSTTILAIRSDGERPNFHALGASLFAEADADTMKAACAAKFVHYAGVGGVKLNGGPGAALVAAAKAAGVTVTCDLIGPNAKTMAELETVLPYVDYFMPNMEEAFFLTGLQNPRAAAERFLRMGAKTCIFKWGARGAYVATRNEETILPAHKIEVVDTTSCGDSYCAGFIAACDRGMNVLDACRFAGATAALVAQAPGTLGALVDFDATLRYQRETPLRDDA
ncbi:MAG TPA: carbohydrate kinase family protein [Rhizomicrobium sp.]|nr:carbohydrate kinase family protein [Rhizomicrobium sp.]